MVEQVTSKKFNLEGWSLKEWFKGNFKSIKEVIKVGLPLMIAWAQTNDPAMVGLITILGKFIMDLGEYYIKEQRI